ncbi:uncharacterized protein SAPINGB_P005226 [Magnusiomyces paraingens]|uniref:Endonuclease/exonuclease/phosphatase domain-containing protein n=1 Tax=Magnusiomyces paraingens TaxID=2606893 RepID=A0A5E8C1A1_9ASCO|nr:uncharacterized protein SAPINGB_P005226 [Saprochaete ingens]VVT56710.1 unnamed protein product [Saprochaete ingens]
MVTILVKDITIVNVYNQPKPSKKYPEPPVFEFLKREIKEQYSKIVIAGDYNLHHKEWESRADWEKFDKELSSAIKDFNVHNKTLKSTDQIDDQAKVLEEVVKRAMAKSMKEVKVMKKSKRYWNQELREKKEDGTLTTTVDEKRHEIWKALLPEIDHGLDREFEIDDDSRWPKLEFDEVDSALADTPNDKAPGDDGITGKVLKMAWLNKDFKERFFKLLQACVKFGYHPKVWRHGIIVVIYLNLRNLTIQSQEHTDQFPYLRFHLKYWKKLYKKNDQTYNALTSTRAIWGRQGYCATDAVLELKFIGRHNGGYETTQSTYKLDIPIYEKVQLTLPNGELREPQKEVKLLGITLNNLLDFKSHILNKINKARKAVGAIWHLGGVQKNMALRRIVGAYRTTPIAVLQKEVGIMPYSIRLKFMVARKAIRLHLNISKTNPINGHLLTLIEKSPIAKLTTLYMLAKDDRDYMIKKDEKRKCKRVEPLTLKQQQNQTIGILKKQAMEEWQEMYWNSSKDLWYHNITVESKCTDNLSKMVTGVIMKKDSRRILSNITQFRTGHGNFGAWFKKFGIEKDSYNCKCGELETVHHILVECPLLEEERKGLKRISPEMDMSTLLNSLTGLQEIVSFISAWRD